MNTRSAAALLGAAACLAGCGRHPSAPPSVLLVTLEGVRADRVGSYGYAGARTPRLDSIARDGVLFDRAFAAAPLCLPAVTTILTGRSPGTHGLREDVGALSPGVPLLSEAFQARGYRTAAFVATDALGRAGGLVRGFQEYVDDFGAGGKRPGHMEKGTARDTTDAALRWLAAAGASGPAFAWVHLGRDAPAAGEGEAAAANPGYDAGLGAADGQLGRLVDAFRASRPDLAIAVVADHGEALGDHGEEGFGYFVYGATTRVPLLISYPAVLPRGRRVTPIVRAMDVAPTLLDLAGVPAPRGLEGVSLVPLMTGRVAEGPGPAPIENASLESKYGLSPLFAIRSGPHLYVRAPRPELYDTEEDPGETVELSARLSRVAARLDSELGRWAPDARPGLRDPKDALDLYHRYRQALDLHEHGELSRAIEGYQAVLKEAPGFVFAERRLAEALLREGKTSEAEKWLADLLEQGHASEPTYLNLALIRFRTGDREGALRLLQRGVETLPASAALHHRVGRLLLELNRPSDAAPQLALAVELEPRLLDGHLALAEALEAGGRTREARAEYQAVLKVSGGESSTEAKRAAEALARLNVGSP
jgi:choline-sulfatase